MATQKGGVGLREVAGLLKSRQSTPSHSGAEQRIEETVEADDDEELSTDLDEDEEEFETEADGVKVLYSIRCISDFNAQECGDLSFKAGEILQVLESSHDDGWLLAENALGERGLIPGNYVKKQTEEFARTTPTLNATTSNNMQSGKSLWAKLRTSVKQTSLADVLSAMGAVPAGFRESTLAKLLNDTDSHRTSQWLFPKPSSTGMAFCDLIWNHDMEQLRTRPVAVCRDLRILTAKMIPLPGKGIQILSRQLYLALYNKNEIVSNVHRVNAVWNARDEKSWKFLSKSQSATNSLFYPHCIIQVDTTDPNIEVLCELGITFKREKTGEVGELSCGWCTLPLYEPTGRQVMHKTYELKLHGGSPYESGVELDPAANISATGTRLPPILRRNHTPRLYLQLVNKSRELKNDCCYLPSTMVTCRQYVRMMGCYRQLIGEAFLRGQLGQQLQTSVNKPALNILLQAVDQPDIMDCLLILWRKAIQSVRQADKTSLKFQTRCLEKVALSHIYSLMSSTVLTAPLWHDEDSLRERDKIIQAVSQQQGLQPLLGPEARPSPFTVKEQIFSIYP